jgi:hexosaminidase
VDLSIVPAPAFYAPRQGSYEINAGTRISGPPGYAVAFLGALLRLPTGEGGDIRLTLDGPADLGREGYLLETGEAGVRLRAHTDEGLFRGVQTLRQLLPGKLEPGGTWRLPGVRIEDRPRFAWRGVMLDVARHFFPVQEVKRFLDLAEPYKINVFHLHLTDDQGWRLAIDGWPRLATYGGGSEVGGGPGGHFTKADYAEIVRYAAERYITVVPEIDMPGHTNAALASYPELNPGGVAPARHTGTEYGFSALDTTDELTYRFLEEVIGEVAALTPGPYLHIGGDEAKVIRPEDYAVFLQRAAQMVRAHGKALVGWREIAAAPLTPGDVVQYWGRDGGSGHHTAAAREAVRKGAQLIMSPSHHTYLDQKYALDEPLGLGWAAPLEARKAYEWDPVTLIDGISERDVLGVEAPLWTETLSSWTDLAYMTLPRLPCIAEVGWSPAGRSWSEYAPRLAAQAHHWSASGVPYHRSPEVPWP